MKFISAIDVKQSVLKQFFEEKWSALGEKENLHRDGILVEYDQAYKAFFALVPVEKTGFWLRSLYIKEGVPTTLPVAIIESSIALAREKGATDLFVYSHQSSLNALLSLLQFEQQPHVSFANETEQGTGSWWKVDCQPLGSNTSSRV